MASTQATLTLVMKAKNLAGSAVASIQADLDKVATKARETGSKVSESAKKMGNAFANAIGNAVENLVQGGDLGPTLALAGAYMAGQLAEEFGGKLIEKLGASSFVAAIGGAASALGTAIGGLIDTGIAVGMAALPVILVGVLLAAIAYLIMHPELMVQISELGQKLSREFVLAVGRGLQALGGIVSNAFRSMSVDAGNFHIHNGHISVDLPDLTASLSSVIPGIPHHAAGGWVGLNGPELGVLGEQGPEYISPAGQAPQQPGLTVTGISERDLLKMVDQGLYFRLQQRPT